MRRIGIVGPNMGRNPGRVTTQTEVLADHLASSGYLVRETSSHPHPVARAGEITRDLLRWGRSVDVLIVAVYSGRSFAYAELAGVLGRGLGRPSVLVLHGANLVAFADQQPRRVDRLLRSAARVVAPSPWLARWAASRGVEAEVIPNILPGGVPARRSSANATPTLLWIRTFHEWYDPMLALEVLARVSDQHPDARLTMAGQDDGMRAAVVERSRELGLADRVRFPGFLGPDAKRRELGAHDIFLNTTPHDNAPVTVVEALAAGLVVVSSDGGGMRQLVTDGETALLVPPRDAAAMTAAVLQILADSALATRLSATGRSAAQGFSWEAVRPRWERLFGRLADAG